MTYHPRALAAGILAWPENLQTVWVTKFKDWGVEPVRLPAMGTFCGRGLLTTEGPRWEYSRALLKPSFTKANMTDLSVFEGYVRLVLDQIPRDGSTVDLQPLFFNLVRSQYIETLAKHSVLIILIVSGYSDLVPIWRFF